MWPWWLQLLFPFCLALFLYYVHFKLVASKYWKNRNVFQLDPVFLLGNSWKGLFSNSFSFILQERYAQWKDKKLVGYWSFTTPTLLVTDLDLIRRILVRDFVHFTDRNINVNEDIDPLAGHLVNLTGSKWRNLRVKLTPTFTSGKMKIMFPVMVECGLGLRQFLEKRSVEEEQLEVRELLARFTTDIISSCAFGIETNTINNPHSEFRTYGRKIFQANFSLVFRFILTSFFPRVRNFLRIRTIPKDVSDFFINIVRETMDHRQLKGIKRNDFMDLLIQLKTKGTVDDADASHKNVPTRDASPPSSPTPPTPHAPHHQFTLTEAASQAFVFFAAGFETSSTTLSFAFYELALNPDVQDTLQKEIDASLNSHHGQITYDGIMAMEYLDWVIQETLRKYPPLPFLGRKCTKDYDIPEMKVTLEEGTRVLISVLGIHRDPRYFPEPDKFEPTRFSPEEKSRRDRLTSLAFGEGPRNCIGNRFGLLQTKVGLVSVLSEFSVHVSEKTPIPLVLNKRAFILSPTGGIHLRITKRNHNTF